MALVILTWLKNNWWVVAALVLVAAIFYGGYHLGGEIQLAQDQSEIQQIKDDAQKAQDKLQADLNSSSQKYEAARTKFTSTLAAVKKELTNAEIANHAFNTCHAGNDFMRLYSDVAGFSAAGDAASQSHP